MKFFILFIIILISINIKAQKNQWTVAAGSSIQQTLGDSVAYKYQQFLPGFVYFRDEKISRASLNLNFVTGEMQFISPSNDTLAVANEATVQLIAIEKDTFYFDKIFIELIKRNAVAKLGKIEAIIQSDLKKEGAYGQMSSTTGISTITSFYTGSQSYKLTEKSEITLRKKTMYFIGNNFNHFLPANKRNVLKIFNTKATAIELFIKDNNSSFTNEADLDKLIDFIGQN